MNSQTHKLTKSSDQKFTYASSRKLKFLHFILQIHSDFHSVLAKIQAIKLVKSHPFQPFTPLPLSIFENKSCILHHLAFLDWSLTHNFSPPTTCFQHLKTRFLTTISPFSTTCFMVRKGYIYTFTVYVYAFCLALSTILHCIQHHFTLRLAAKRTAFSTILPRIQHQNALCFAAYCSAFCCKQPKIWYKGRFIGINIQFVSIHITTLFASKPTFARIDFLRQGKRLVNYDGTHNVKKRSKNITKSELIRP